MTPEFDAPEGGYFEHWMEALEELDRALPERARPACPNCGRRELRAQYIGDPEDRIGYGAIWCDHCHWGAYTGRAEIPPAADLLPFGVSDDVVRTRVPSFREDLASARRRRHRGIRGRDRRGAGRTMSSPPWFGS